MVTGGVLSYPPFRVDQMIVNDEDDTLLVFTNWAVVDFSNRIDTHGLSRGH